MKDIVIAWLTTIIFFLTTCYLPVAFYQCSWAFWEWTKGGRYVYSLSFFIVVIMTTIVYSAHISSKYKQR